MHVNLNAPPPWLPCRRGGHAQRSLAHVDSGPARSSPPVVPGKELRIASWSVNGFFVAVGRDRARHKGKLRVLWELADLSDAVALQWRHGHAADLGELLKVFPACFGVGALADLRSARCTFVLVRKALLSDATSILPQPLEGGRSIRMMQEFPNGSANLLAIHSDLAQTVALRRHWLRHSLCT